jgi:4-carboxymuconolactone decarboxylase
LIIEAYTLSENLPSMPRPRIAPIEPPYQPETAAMLAKWMPPDSGDIETLKLFRTLAVHDGLFSRMRPLGAGLLGHPRLDPRDREIVILRTCARADAEYEWGVHAVAFARQLGLTDAQVTASAAGNADDPVWSAQDAELIAAADSLYDSCGIPDELWASLADRLSQDQLIELVVLAGWYRLLSGVINAAQIDLEPWADRFP